MISVEHFSKVQADFPAYAAFLAQNKVVQTNPVLLAQKIPKVAYTGYSDVQTGRVDFPCFFEVSRSLKSRLKYELKIFAAHFGSGPCFRFCSRSGVHFNRETGDGLQARGVPTPHFHRIDDRGTLFAYQTPSLLNAVESAEVVANLQAGTNLFCQEANLFSKNGSFVSVEDKPAELDFSNDDPLNEAIFPQQ